MELWEEDFSISESVYEPSEDSLMLARYAGIARGEILDMGTGCGICAIAAAKANGKNSVLAVDINPSAVRCARKNSEKLGAKNISFLLSDLFVKIPKGKRFDFILFNPPYLPTSRGERLAKGENRAYDGGGTGRKVIDKFLFAFGRFLARGGSLLLLDSSLDNTAKTIKALERKGFAVEVLESRSFFFEKLSVLLAKRKAIEGVAYG